MSPSSGALCDDWERHDPGGRTVLGFNFFLLQADAIPAEGSRRTERRDPITRAFTDAFTDAHLDRGDGGDGGDGEYGRVTKRMIKRFDCNERWSRRETKKKNGTAPEV